MFQEIILLKFLLSRENFVRYGSYIKDLNLEPESETVLSSIQSYFQEFPDKEQISVSEILLYTSLRNPLVKKKETYINLFTRLEKLELNSQLVEENFNNILERYFSSEILYKITESLENETAGVIACVGKIVEDYDKTKLHLAKNDTTFVSQDLVSIIKKQVEEPGIKWRIQSLNVHLGDIRGKTLGHVFARVDTGKTSFILSEEAYWVTQLQDDEYVIHFNNEEDGEKIMARFYQAVLNCDKALLASHPEKCQQEFQRRGGNKFLLYDEAIITIEDIETILIKYKGKVRVITIDQADKVSFVGMAKLGDIARLQTTYAKLRDLSKKYNVHILTVGQASQSAENKKWLLSTDLDSSKTLKPGEFDYIIGIGRMFGDACSAAEDIRYIHLCKNKLGTGQHAQLEVLLDTTRALYREPTYAELEGAYGNIPQSQSPDRLSYVNYSDVP